MFKMRRCTSCWTYTFKDVCPRCGAPTVNPHPPRFSPLDRYGRYRRKMLYGDDHVDR